MHPKRGRRPNPAKSSAMAELNVHFQEHGSSDVSLLANKYQHIPKPTWNRWVAEARCATVRATVATAVV